MGKMNAIRREVLRLHQSTGINDLGSIRTPLAIYLAIVFTCIYFAIWKGVKSTGKVSSFAIGARTGIHK